ncbi:hypothetical protein H4J50_19325, partial [Colwellia sp. 6M3]|nr:hypothetical protein [Colwellia sp. 6M3]
LARNGHKTLLWGRDENHVAEMASSRANEKYLPGSSFPETLVVLPLYFYAIIYWHFILRYFHFYAEAKSEANFS